MKHSIVFKDGEGNVISEMLDNGEGAVWRGDRRQAVINFNTALKNIDAMFIKKVFGWKSKAVKTPKKV